MKIETRDMAPASGPEPIRTLNRGLMRRAMLTAVLALFLLVSLRWAVSVTNANARQLSTNLTSLQDRIDQHGQAAVGSVTARDAVALSGDGPTLDPVDETAPRSHMQR